MLYKLTCEIGSNRQIRLAVAAITAVSSLLTPQAHTSSPEPQPVAAVPQYPVTNPLETRFDPMGYYYLSQLHTEQQHKPKERANRGLARRTTQSSSNTWDRLAECESGNTNDHDAPYYGYWQFSAGTWHSLGYTGLPDSYPRETQLEAAIRLQARSGWSSWPACAKKLGLL